MNIQTNGIHSRHISSALVVCQTIGFTHIRIHRASPLSLVARSRTLTQPLQSLYPVCMYSGKRHRWGRVMSFGLMPHRIHTNSSNRQTAFALFAFNEATHISRFGGMVVTRSHPRHISSALVVCQSIGFTHRRIRRVSPLCSGHPVSPTHSTRTVSLSVMHVHW